MATVLQPSVGNVGLATTPPPVTEQLTEIASDVAADAGTLLEKHVALLRAELATGVREAKAGGAMVTVGAGWVVFGGAFLLVGLVKLLQRATELPEYACWLIGGGALLALGFGLAYAGGRMLTRIDLVPHRTLHNIQETWSWIVNRRT